MWHPQYRSCQFLLRLWKGIIVMEKKEYLNIRFKQDFLRYSLLQEDSLSAKEIADKLYKIVDCTHFIHKCKKKVEELLEKYLSFDKVKLEGKLSNELSDELEIGLQDKIIKEFQQCVEGCKVEELSGHMLNIVVHNIEKLAWSNGVIEMSSSINLFVERLNDAVNNYKRIHIPCISESELVSKYNEAKENTFFERIQGNNINDIIEYRNALREYVEAKCGNMIYECVISILKKLASQNIFRQLQDNFQNIHQYALELKASLRELEPNAEWDAEYNKAVPTDFYYRNVEGITAEQAFHMVLFQFFAKNEDWMAKTGLLMNGELKIFTNKTIVISDILCVLIKSVISKC